MEVTIRSGDTVVTVAVRGDIDIDTSAQLRAELLAVIDNGGRDILVDLTGVSFMDSTGLGAFVACLKHARSRDSDLRVIGASSAVRRVFEVTGLTDVFPLDSWPPRSDPE